MARVKRIFQNYALAIFCLWIGSSIAAEEMTLNLNVKKPIAVVSDKFLSITLDPVVLFNSDLLNDVERSTNMAKALAPAYVRVGGPRSNSYVFERSLYPQEIRKDPDYAISEMHWTNVHQWAERSGLEVIACIAPQQTEGTKSSAWDPRNALDLISFSDHMGYNTSWQLGYECQERCEINGADLGRHVQRLRSMLDAFPRFAEHGIIAGPDVVAYKTRLQQQYLQDYFNAAGSSLAAVTWHPEFAGVSLEDDGVSMHYDNIAVEKETLYRVIGRHILKKPLWLAESKPEQCKQQFLGALVWARRLGNSAKLGVQVLMRQPDNSNLFRPTPDYWVSMLHKMLVGREVLDMKVTTGNRTHVHFYCQCTKPSEKYERGSLTIFGINLTPSKVTATLKGFKLKIVHKYILLPGYDAPNRMFAETVLLNNELLTLIDGKEVPDLQPSVNSAEKGVKLKLPSGGIGFWVLPDLKIKTCMGNEEDIAEKNILKRLNKRLDDFEIEDDLAPGEDNNRDIPDDIDSIEDRRTPFRQIQPPLQRRLPARRSIRQRDIDREDDRNLRRIEGLKRESDRYEKIHRKRDSHSANVKRGVYSNSEEKITSSEEAVVKKIANGEPLDSGERIRAKVQKYKKRLIDYKNKKKQRDVITSKDHTTDNKSGLSKKGMDTEKVIEALTLITKVESAMKGLDKDNKTERHTLSSGDFFDVTSGLPKSKKNEDDGLLGEILNTEKSKRTTIPTKIEDQLKALYHLLADEKERKHGLLTSRQRRDLDKRLGDDPLGLRRDSTFLQKRMKFEEAKERRLERANERRQRIREKIEELRREREESKKEPRDSIENNFYGFQYRAPLSNFPEGDLYLQTASELPIRDNIADRQMKRSDAIDEHENIWLEEGDTNHMPKELYENVRLQNFNVKDSMKDYGEILEAETVPKDKSEENNKQADNATHHADSVIVTEKPISEMENRQVKEQAVQQLRNYYDASPPEQVYDFEELRQQQLQQQTLPQQQLIPQQQMYYQPAATLNYQPTSVPINNPSLYADPKQTIPTDIANRYYMNPLQYTQNSKVAYPRSKRSMNNLEALLHQEMIDQDDNNLRDCQCRVIRGTEKCKDCQARTEKELQISVQNSEQKLQYPANVEYDRPLRYRRNVEDLDDDEESDEDTSEIELLPADVSDEVETVRNGEEGDDYGMKFKRDIKEDSRKDTSTVEISPGKIETEDEIEEVSIVSETEPTESVMLTATKKYSDASDETDIIGTELGDSVTEISTEEPEVSPENVGATIQDEIEMVTINYPVQAEELDIAADVGSPHETLDESFEMKESTPTLTEEPIQLESDGDEQSRLRRKIDLKFFRQSRENSSSTTQSRKENSKSSPYAPTFKTKSTTTIPIESTPTIAIESNPTIATKSAPIAPIKSAPIAPIKSAPKVAIKSTPTAAIKSAPTVKSVRAITIKSTPAITVKPVAEHVAISRSVEHPTINDSTATSTQANNPGIVPIINESQLHGTESISHATINQATAKFGTNFETATNDKTIENSAIAKNNAKSVIYPGQIPYREATIDPSTVKTIPSTGYEENINTKNIKNPVIINSNTSKGTTSEASGDQALNTADVNKLQSKQDSIVKSSSTNIKKLNSIPTETKNKSNSTSKAEDMVKIRQARLTTRAEALAALRKENESRRAKKMIEMSMKLIDSESARFAEYQKRRQEQLERLKEKLRTKREKMLQQYREELIEAINESSDLKERKIHRRDLLDEYNDSDDNPSPSNTYPRYESIDGKRYQRQVRSWNEPNDDSEEYEIQNEKKRSIPLDTQGTYSESIEEEFRPANIKRSTHALFDYNNKKKRPVVDGDSGEFYTPEQQLELQRTMEEQQKLLKHKKLRLIEQRKQQRYKKNHDLSQHKRLAEQEDLYQQQLARYYQQYGYDPRYAANPYQYNPAANYYYQHPSSAANYHYQQPDVNPYSQYNQHALYPQQQPESALANREPENSYYQSIPEKSDSYNHQQPGIAQQSETSQYPVPVTTDQSDIAVHQQRPEDNPQQQVPLPQQPDGTIQQPATTQQYQTPSHQQQYYNQQPTAAQQSEIPYYQQQATPQQRPENAYYKHPYAVNTYNQQSTSVPEQPQEHSYLYGTAQPTNITSPTQESENARYQAITHQDPVQSVDTLNYHKYQQQQSDKKLEFPEQQRKDQQSERIYQQPMSNTDFYNGLLYDTNRGHPQALQDLTYNRREHSYQNHHRPISSRKFERRLGHADYRKAKRSNMKILEIDPYIYDDEDFDYNMHDLYMRPSSRRGSRFSRHEPDDYYYRRYRRQTEADRIDDAPLSFKLGLEKSKMSRKKTQNSAAAMDLVRRKRFADHSENEKPFQIGSPLIKNIKKVHQTDYDEKYKNSPKNPKYTRQSQEPTEISMEPTREIISHVPEPLENIPSKVQSLDPNNDLGETQHDQINQRKKRSIDINNKFRLKSNKIDSERDNDSEMNEIWHDIVEMKQDEELLEEFERQKGHIMETFEDAQRNLKSYLLSKNSSTTQKPKESTTKTNIESMLVDAIPKLETVITNGLEKAKNVTGNFEDFIVNFEEEDLETTMNPKDASESHEVTDMDNGRLSHSIFKSMVGGVKKFFGLVSNITKVFQD